MLQRVSPPSRLRAGGFYPTPVSTRPRIDLTLRTLRVRAWRVRPPRSYRARSRVPEELPKIQVDRGRTVFDEAPNLGPSAVVRRRADDLHRSILRSSSEYNRRSFSRPRRGCQLVAFSGWSRILWSWFLFVIFTSCQKCGLLHQMRPAWGATSALPWWSPGPTSAPSPCLPGTLTRDLGHSLRCRAPVTGSPVTLGRRPGRRPADCLVGAPAGCQQFWPPPGPETGVGRALTGAGRALTGASHAVTSLKGWELSASARNWPSWELAPA